MPLHATGHEKLMTHFQNGLILQRMFTNFISFLFPSITQSNGLNQILRNKAITFLDAYSSTIGIHNIVYFKPSASDRCPHFTPAKPIIIATLWKRGAYCSTNKLLQKRISTPSLHYHLKWPSTPPHDAGYTPTTPKHNNHT